MLYNLLLLITPVIGCITGIISFSLYKRVAHRQDIIMLALQSLTSQLAGTTSATDDLGNAVESLLGMWDQMEEEITNLTNEILLNDDDEDTPEVGYLH